MLALALASLEELIHEKCVRTLISRWELPHAFFPHLKQRGYGCKSHSIFS